MVQSMNKTHPTVSASIHTGKPRQITGLTMYQTPRMMVPVRTWQHRQQLVENQRSHGDIILLFPSIAAAGAFRGAELRSRLSGSADPSVTYGRKLICGTKRRTSSQRQVSIALPVPYLGRDIFSSSLKYNNFCNYFFCRVYICFKYDIH